MNENDNINEIICSFCDGGKEKTISHSSDSKEEIINTNKTNMIIPCKCKGLSHPYCAMVHCVINFITYCDSCGCRYNIQIVRRKKSKCSQFKYIFSYLLIIFLFAGISSITIIWIRDRSTENSRSTVFVWMPVLKLISANLERAF